MNTPSSLFCLHYYCSSQAHSSNIATEHRITRHKRKYQFYALELKSLKHKIRLLQITIFFELKKGNYNCRRREKIIDVKQYIVME